MIPSAWNEETNQRIKAYEDDQLNLVDLFSDDETTRAPDETVSPDGLFDTDILFDNSLDLHPVVDTPMDFDAVEGMDLFDSDDGGDKSPSPRSSPPPTSPTDVPTPASTVDRLLDQVHNQEVDELQQELTRLREETRGLALECAQHKEEAESWRKQLDEAGSGNEAREALLDTQRKDIKDLQKESGTLLETVEKLRETLAIENGKLSKKMDELQKERSDCAQVKRELHQNLQVIQKLKDELEASKLAAKQAVDAIKALHDKSVQENATLRREHELEREWIKKFRTENDFRIRCLQEKCQPPPSDTKETQTVVIALKDAGMATPPSIDGGSTKQNLPAEIGSGTEGKAAMAEISSHALLCLWEYCNLVCPTYDYLRSHMVEEHL